MLIAKVKGAEGIEAVVNQIGAAKFSVTLHDTDADMFFPQARIYDNLPAAMAYANTIQEVL